MKLGDWILLALFVAGCTVFSVLGYNLGENHRGDVCDSISASVR